MLTVYFWDIIMTYWMRSVYFAMFPGKEIISMALTPARKKANAKYEAKAYDKTLIRLPKGRLDEIRAYIEPAGESLNGFINRAIGETLKRDGAAALEEPAEATGGASAGTALLPPEVMETAQEAAKATGEAISDFVRRAVENEAKRDKASLRMGISPVTGERIAKEVV